MDVLQKNIETFKIKSVAPLRMTTPRQREAHLEAAGNTLFKRFRTC
jgi:hypothetical protein